MSNPMDKPIPEINVPILPHLHQRVQNRLSSKEFRTTLRNFQSG